METVEKRKPGRPKKIKQPEGFDDTPVVVAPKEIENVKDEEKDEVKEAKEEFRKDVLNKPVVDALQPGQAYFESPDGDIVIGEADKQQLWHRKLNNGHGGWINKKR